MTSADVLEIIRMAISKLSSIESNDISDEVSSMLQVRTMIRITSQEEIIINPGC